MSTEHPRRDFPKGLLQAARVQHRPKAPTQEIKVVQKVLIKSIIGAVEPKELFLEKREKGKGRTREQKEKRERRET